MITDKPYKVIPDYSDPTGELTMGFPFWEDWPLPEFAHQRATPGVIEPMLQLCTRDGRRTGNATVAFITVNTAVPNPALQAFFHVYTDADNEMILNIEELNELFTFGPYVLKEFPNPLSRER